MNTTQIIGIPILIFGVYVFKWGYKDIMADKIDWYATARDFGTAIITTMLGILMILDKVEF